MVTQSHTHRAHPAAERPWAHAYCPHPSCALCFGQLLVSGLHVPELQGSCAVGLRSQSHGSGGSGWWNLKGHVCCGDSALSLYTHHIGILCQALSCPVCKCRGAVHAARSLVNSPPGLGPLVFAAKSLVLFGEAVGGL